MSIVVLILGLVLGAAAAAAALSRRLRALGAELAARVAELEQQRALQAAAAERHAAELDALRAHHERDLAAAREQVRLVQASREQLRDELKSISADVLRETGETLTRELAAQRRADQERAAGEMEKRAAELRGLVEPMRDKLGRVETEIGRLERERREAQGQLGQMVRQLTEGLGALRQETGSLVSALKRPSTRGSWGEIQLRNVIEMAGMVQHCDFVEQASFQTDEGRLRPDVVVRLPGGKAIVVDAKVPLDAYLAHLEAQDDTARDLHIARHARQTRDHVTKLASRGYQAQLDESPDFVVMFIPSDGIYQAAIAEDPALLEYGFQHQVLIATPTTLIAMLRAVHYGWKQELIAESAREIAACGRELHRRMGRFGESFAKVGRQLDSATKAYNEAVGSYDLRVVPQLRRIEEAGAKSDREIAAPPPIETAPRTPSARLEVEPGEADELLPPPRDAAGALAAAERVAPAAVGVASTGDEPGCD